jgi:Rps23 Pro-64 3,4-dihydroxylase Tpa1-like proline 4-hydroxylase
MATNSLQRTPPTATDMTKTFSRQIAEKIIGNREHLRLQWKNPEGTHTRHFVIDGLLPADAADSVHAAFPENSPVWYQRRSFREAKKTFAKLGAIDSLIGEITDAFHTDEVLQAVRDVTELDGLEADPELYAGGISMMGKGDFLNPHIDNSHDAARKRYRRLNLLYYISPGWRLEYGGNFELWDMSVRTPKVITSAFNRLVVMETNRFSWHSVNPVLVDRNRCCISNYYFSTASPERRPYYHVTSFNGRPEQRLARFWGPIDNFMRQSVAVVTGISRGKSQARYN